MNNGMVRRDDEEERDRQIVEEHVKITEVQTNQTNSGTDKMLHVKRNR